MKLDLTIRVNATGEDLSHSAAIKISDPFVQAFEPVSVTDEPMMMLFGEISHAQAQIKYKFREEVAGEIAEALTIHLIGAMKSKDSFNGYPIKGE